MDGDPREVGELGRVGGHKVDVERRRRVGGCPDDLEERVVQNQVLPREKALDLVAIEGYVIDDPRTTTAAVLQPRCNGGKELVALNERERAPGEAGQNGGIEAEDPRVGVRGGGERRDAANLPVRVDESD